MQMSKQGQSKIETSNNNNNNNNNKSFIYTQYWRYLSALYNAGLNKMCTK